MNSAQEAALNDLIEVQKAYYSNIAYSPYQDLIMMKQLKDVVVKELYKSYYSEGISSGFNEQDIDNNLQKTIDTKLSSTFENPFIYKSLVKQTKKIENVISEFEMELPLPLIFGTLQTPEVNACVWLSSRKDCCIIGLNAGVIGYLHKISKLVYRLVGFEDKGSDYAFSYDKKKIDLLLQKNSKFSNHIIEILDAIIMRGNVYDAPRLETDFVRDTMATRMFKNAELFIVGHEYGHVLNGDISAKKAIKKIINNIEYEEQQLSWEEEFNADLMGAYLTLSCQMMDFEENREDIANIYIGIDFFFGALDILDKALSLLTYGNEKEWHSQSHPSSYSRRASLRENLFELLFQMTSKTEKERQFMEKNVASAKVLYESIQYILDGLWEKTKGTYLDYYNKGLKPSPIWIN
jgi:hypothetical protein